MVVSFLLRRLSVEGRPWTLKQVQGDKMEKLYRENRTQSFSRSRISLPGLK
jgi:hypothetical protein